MSKIGIWSGRDDACSKYYSIIKHSISRSLTNEKFNIKFNNLIDIIHLDNTNNDMEYISLSYNWLKYLFIVLDWDTHIANWILNIPMWII